MAELDDISLVPVRNELLCFIIDKCNVIPVAQLTKLCTDFYREKEITTARDLLMQVFPKRISPRQGQGKMKNTMDDIIKCCLDPGCELPQYYAVDLSRLPPVDMSHCDMASVLKELQGLRLEVRAITELRAEVDSLRLALSDMTLPGVSKPTTLTPALLTPVTSNDTRQFMPNAVVSRTGSYAAVAVDMVARGGISASNSVSTKITPSKNVKNNRKAVVGKSNNDRVKSVATMRSVNVFVSRLDPGTTCDDLTKCIEDIKGDINVKNIVCNKLQSRYEELYSSYHVEIKVDSNDFSNALTMFLSADTWPSGVFVKSYFKIKNGD